MSAPKGPYARLTEGEYAAVRRFVACQGGGGGAADLYVERAAEAVAGAVEYLADALADPDLAPELTADERTRVAAACLADDFVLALTVAAPELVRESDDEPTAEATIAVLRFLTFVEARGIRLFDGEVQIGDHELDHADVFRLLARWCDGAPWPT